uniref:Uncharacterized protein n=1 Tax=Glossina morsitans morsitans TaxID=37546 RepID=A0A1B0FPG9_GLOMM
MVKDSHCVGLTFPGIMELPGSFSGNDSSPKPHRGPEPKKPSRAPRASKKLGAGLKGKQVISLIRAEHFSANPLRVFKPVPTAVPPKANTLHLVTVHIGLCAGAGLPYNQRKMICIV